MIPREVHCISAPLGCKDLDSIRIFGVRRKRRRYVVSQKGGDHRQVAPVANGDAVEVHNWHNLDVLGQANSHTLQSKGPPWKTLLEFTDDDKDNARTANALETQ